MALDRQEQADFSAGMFRVRAREKIPANGAWDLENCVIDPSGQAIRRGGSGFYSAAFGANGLTNVWDGRLAGQQITVVGDAGGLGYTFASSEPTTPIAAIAGSASQVFPHRPTATTDTLIFPGGSFVKNTAGVISTGTYAPQRSYYAMAGNRLWACSNNRAEMSGIGAYTSFGATDFHDLPEGVRILGAVGTRDRLALFTTGGIWTVSGVELDLTDDFGNVQQSLDHFSRDVLLWHNNGIAGWRGGTIVPALDALWLMPLGVDPAAGAQPFRNLSEPIEDMYQEYVQTLGCLPGPATVYRGHYLLPILRDGDYAPIDLLVCRLDTGAWTRMSGSAGYVRAVAVRSLGSAQPLLLGAQAEVASRLSSLRFFDSRSTAPRSDANGTTGRFQIITRDFRMGPSQTKSFVKKLRVAAVMTDAATDDPTMEAAYSTEEPTDSTETGMTVLTGAGAEDATGAAYRTWRVNARAERVRFRLRVALPTARLAVRSVQVFSRTTGRP